MQPLKNDLLTGRTPAFDSDAILSYLTLRQHVRPHMPVGILLDETIQTFDCCPEAVVRGIEWLKIDPAGAVGRLRRSQLVQLARAIHRFWTRNLNAAASASQ